MTIKNNDIADILEGMLTDAGDQWVGDHWARAWILLAELRHEDVETTVRLVMHTSDLAVPVIMKDIKRYLDTQRA